MNEQEEPQIDADAYAEGWRRELKDAVNAELESKKAPLDKPFEIDIWVKRRTQNPIHDYRVVLRPGG